jgi:hypothetical protein
MGEGLTFYWIIALSALGLIFFLFRKSAFVSKYWRITQAILYVNVLLLLCNHFYAKGQWMSIAAVALGGMAIGKYFWDAQRR